MAWEPRTGREGTRECYGLNVEGFVPNNSRVKSLAMLRGGGPVRTDWGLVTRLLLTLPHFLGFLSYHVISPS
jgi:hypothetical protein